MSRTAEEPDQLTKYFASIYSKVSIVVFFGMKFNSKPRWEAEAMIDGKSYNAGSGKSLDRALEALKMEISKDNGDSEKCQGQSR